MGIIIIRNSIFMGYEIGKLCQCRLFMQKDNDPLAPAALEQRDKEEQQRMFSPPAARNSAPILDVIKHVLPKRGLALEIGCGTGEHVVSFGESMPNLMWQPSDPDLGSRASTASWIAASPEVPRASASSAGIACLLGGRCTSSCSCS